MVGTLPLGLNLEARGCEASEGLDLLRAVRPLLRELTKLAFILNSKFKH